MSSNSGCSLSGQSAVVFTSALVAGFGLIVCSAILLSSFEGSIFIRVSNSIHTNDSAIDISRATGAVTYYVCGNVTGTIGQVPFLCTGCSSKSVLEPQIGTQPPELSSRRSASFLSTRPTPDQICIDKNECGATLDFARCTNKDNLIDGCDFSTAGTLQALLLVSTIFGILGFSLNCCVGFGGFLSRGFWERQGDSAPLGTLIVPVWMALSGVIIAPCAFVASPMLTTLYESKTLCKDAKVSETTAESITTTSLQDRGYTINSSVSVPASFIALGVFGCIFFCMGVCHVIYHFKYQSEYMLEKEEKNAEGHGKRLDHLEVPKCEVDGKKQTQKETGGKMKKQKKHTEKKKNKQKETDVEENESDSDEHEPVERE